MNTVQAKAYLDAASAMLDVAIPAELADGVDQNVTLFLHHFGIVEQALADDLLSNEV